MLRAFVEDFVELTPEGVWIDPYFIFYGRRSYGRILRRQDGRAPWAASGTQRGDHQRHRDIAFAVEQRLEEAGLHLARPALRETGSRNLCVAGGVALNCKMTGVLHRARLAD